MGGFLSIPILALAAALQASFVPQIRVGGGGPDLVFLLVVAWSINVEMDEGLVWAFVGGVMQDLLSAAPTGASVLGLILIVFVISGLNRQVYRVGFLLLTVLVLLGTVFQQIVLMIVLTLSGFRILLPFDLNYIVTPTIVYNFILIWPVYYFVRRVQKRLSR